MKHLIAEQTKLHVIAYSKGEAVHKQSVILNADLLISGLQVLYLISWCTEENNSQVKKFDILFCLETAN